MTCTWAKSCLLWRWQDLFGTTRTVNALGLCDLFIFVWWQDRGKAMIWSSSWSWQEDLLLRESVCVSALLLTRPDAKACSHACLCGLQPSVKQWQAILHPSALSLSWCYTELGQASKTGCESMLLLTGSHKHVVASSFTCFSLYIFVCARLVPFLVLHRVIGQASKTGCESMLLLTGSHTCGSKQLYMF